jgi:hypothetical protein
VTSPHPDPASTLPGQRRAATWPGRRAARPAGAYDPDPAVRDSQEGVEVQFAGEDGRTWTFSFATLPLPGWHGDLAAAFARLTGPTGTWRTLAAAEHVWTVQGRLLRFLDGLRQSPRDVTRLTVRHLRRFELHRQRTCMPVPVANELRTLRRLLDQVTPQDRLPSDVVEWLGYRRRERRRTGVSGYSEQEFRRIMAAARHDVAAIRDRIRVGERLLARARTEPATLTPAERAAAVQLENMARTGKVPIVRLPGSGLWDSRAMVEVAGQLFLTDADLAPLLALGVGITGRNGETLKELPASHELLEDRAIRIELLKRRRGPNNIHEAVHWEIGSPSRQLHAPGGYYLLVHALARRGRLFSGSESVWSIWNVQSGHISPFAKNLKRHLYFRHWVSKHGLLDDDGQPLELSLNAMQLGTSAAYAR